MRLHEFTDFWLLAESAIKPEVPTFPLNSLIK